MLTKPIYSLLLLLTLIATFLSGPCSAGLSFDKSKDKASIWEILTTDSRFSMFIAYIEEVNQTFPFKDLTTGTVFAPTNRAFDTNGYDKIFKRRISSQQIVNHIVPVAVFSNELWDGRLLKTEATVDRVPQVVRIAKTTSGVFVGNGGDQEQSRVSQADIDASNGVIHAIDKIIPLASYVDQVLHANKDTQGFYNMSQVAELNQSLKYSYGVTVFAVQGDQFGDKLSPVERRYLNQPEGKKDLSRILRHQIATKIYYSDGLPEGNSAIKTAEGSEDLEVYVENRKGEPPSIKVNGVNVIKSDILAANGVIHVLEKPILPKHEDFLGPSVRKSLIGLNCTRFIKLFNDNDMGAYLDDNGNGRTTTILAPSNDDISLPDSKEDTKAWLKYHIVHGRWNLQDLHDGQLLETETHHDLSDNSYQRIKVHQDGINNPIQFGRSAVLGDPVSVGDNLIIYHVSESLVLPRDPLSRLPTNLDLSTFVSALYATGQDSTIAKAHDITLFAPNNDAFSRLGLLARYLLQPEAKDKLAQVTSYHGVHGVFYTSEMKEGEHREPTFSSGAEIDLNKTSEGLFVRGSGAADGSDRTVIGQVVKNDMLTSNGVIHTVDRVQIPSTLEVTNRNLLSAEGTHSFLRLLERFDLAKDVLEHLDPSKPYTVLAPSDRAFGKDGLSALNNDRESLLRVAKLHVLPVALPLLDPDEALNTNDKYFKRQNENEHKVIGYTGIDFPTLLDDNNIVTISRNVIGGYSVKVKGSITQESANVINYGRSTTGGGVIEIDRVLVPKKEYNRSDMAWWEIVSLVAGSIAAIALIAVGGYAAWRWYQARRSGSIQLQGED
ncbi:FAS1 domain-containing protein [Parasitella parasitica]|nr:FAS1 domain-containing protein [Parasitella parasitica]